jgi:hypothetical protein
VDSADFFAVAFYDLKTISNEGSAENEIECEAEGSGGTQDVEGKVFFRR